MFTLIKEPDDNPSNLLNSYREQNIIMQKQRLLYTAFDGIKLDHWSDSDRELPNILSGSICEFLGKLYETNSNITLIDNDINDTSKDLRYIKLVKVDDTTLDAFLVGASSLFLGAEFPRYDYENRGFYKINNKVIEKYLRLSMKYDFSLGGYVEKKYYNINDLDRMGQVLKRKTVQFNSGTYEFIFPDDVNSITVHLLSAGAGGYYGVLDTVGTLPKAGGDSQIIIGNDVITTCGGGQIGKKNGTLDFEGGRGGVAKGYGKLINGNNATTTIYTDINSSTGAIFTNNTTLASGRNGGNGSVKGLASCGGGSGSAAIVDITRSMLNISNKIKIVVGSGGAGGLNSNSNGLVANGERGEDGQAVIEYMQK